MRHFFIFLFLLISLSGCLGMPPNVKPVTNFDLNRYLGTWYEVARMDHSFERGMSRVTAHYSLRDDGGVQVINRGFVDDDQQWKTAEGKAYFVDKKDTASLKVSFFGPFYGAYTVFELDEDGYQYALVSGPDLDYLWVLARTPHLEAPLRERLLQRARDAGFATEKLVFVSHP